MHSLAQWSVSHHWYVVPDPGNFSIHSALVAAAHEQRVIMCVGLCGNFLGLLIFTPCARASCAFTQGVASESCRLIAF